MKFKNETLLLVLTFLFALAFRLFYVFKAPFFSSDQAYFHLRHAEYLSQHFFPLVLDPLSYGGNVILNTHLFHYFFAALDLVLPQFITYKIIPAIIASSFVLICYLLARSLTENKLAALFAAILAAFIPIFFSQTLNQISIMSLFLPLFFLTLYTLLHLKRKRNFFLLLSFFLILLDPLNLLLLFTLLIFFLLLYAESIEIKRQQKEAGGLFVILFVLINLIFFKNLYLSKGIGAIWQNLPLSVYGAVFQNFNLFETVTTIGFIPLILGVLGFLLYEKRDRFILLFGSVLLADFSLLLLRLIPFQEGILFLAAVLCITSAVAIHKGMGYLKLTKLAKYTTSVVVFLGIISILSLLIPTIFISTATLQEGVTPDEIEALLWIKEETPENSVILGNVFEGNLIISIAERANVIDTQFFNAEDRVLDVDTVFMTQSLVKASQALSKYGADYIYFSEKTKALYGVEELLYTRGESCFVEVYANEAAVVYEVVC